MSNEKDQLTVVFHPDGTGTPVKEHSTLSTSARLRNYNDHLKESLKNGVDFTKLLDTLITTTDSHELLSAVSRLVSYQLNSAFLIFPQQYSEADFYLIFLSRFLQQHDSNQLILQSSDRNQELYHEFPGINTEGYFVFEIDPQHESGAYYVEKQTGSRLIYLNFKKHILRINSEAVTSLLVVNYHEKFTYATVKKFVLLLIKIGSFFKEDFGFDVDFNILDQSNTAYYPIVKSDLPTEALDKLFVLASQSGYMLLSGPQNEAILKLQPDLVVTFSDESRETGAKEAKWVINVKDKNEQLSWFDLLFQYDFIRKWYLDNLNILEIKVDPRYFN